MNDKVLEKFGDRDLMILDRVLHKKADVQAYLKTVCRLLRDDGFAIINEITASFDTAYTVLSLTANTEDGDPINVNNVV